MATAMLTERYTADLRGVLSCVDRITVTGIRPGARYAQGIRIFEYPRFAKLLREQIRERAQAVRAVAGAEIEHVAKGDIRKEDLVARVLAVCGEAPGLVHVRSALEQCPSYRPWHDKCGGKT